MDHLPNEIIALTATHLSQHDRYHCTLVSHRFYTAINPLLWYAPHLPDNISSEICFHTIVHAHHQPIGQHVRRIELVDFTWTDAKLLLLIQHATQLEALILVDGIHLLSDTSLTQIPKYCPQLKTLKIGIQRPDMDIFGHNPLGSDFLAAVAQCPILETLDLWGLNSAALAPLPRALLDLSSLTDVALQCHPAGGGDPAALFLPPLPSSIKNGSGWWWPHLTRLCLEPCPAMNDTVVAALIQMYPHLTTLELHLCYDGLTDATLSTIQQQLPRIVHLDLSGNRDFTRGSVQRLVKRCTHLIYFGIEGCHFTEFDFDVEDHCLDDNNTDYLKCFDKSALDDIRHDRMGRRICNFALFD